MNWSFNEYQQFAKTTAIYPPESALSYTALGLSSEAGEVAGKIKKYIRDGVKDDDAIIDELGDVLWYLAVLAEELDVDLSIVAQRNTEKLIDRRDRNKLSGSGDKR
jgi:NTP pyrophosphatase (non-canonical NTP hydrolase)